MDTPKHISDLPKRVNGKVSNIKIYRGNLTALARFDRPGNRFVADIWRWKRNPGQWRVQTEIDDKIYWKFENEADAVKFFFDEVLRAANER